MGVVGTPVVIDNSPDPRITSTVEENFRGCTVLNKTRAVIVDKGVNAQVIWELRDRNGNPVDISDYVYDGAENASGVVENFGQVLFRFKNCFDATNQIYQIVGWCISAADGIVSCRLDDYITDSASIYEMTIGITNGVGKLVLVNKGLLSVERDLFGNLLEDSGPPTLGDIRIYMRDSVIENDLLDDVEFSDTEILHALLRPIQEWNETPPPVAYFTPYTFPYREMWFKAAAASLLQTAALWYERNRLQATHGGINVDDKAKANSYLSIAQMFRQEWKDFIITKKVEINVQLAYGSVGSDYD